MAKSPYIVIEVFAGNWRKDGRLRCKGEPKPRATSWGIMGSKRQAEGQAEALRRHYRIADNPQAASVVIEVLPFHTAQARYTLYA